MPSFRDDLGWLTARPIAHRGLHDVGGAIPENSLSAFQAAIDRGFSIECDIHRSRDGIPMVFHDHSLSRMTGADGNLADRTAMELTRLRLGGSQDTIPTFASLLDLIAGRVPLVVEIKGTSELDDKGFLAKLAPILHAYEGPVALMSFDDWILAQADELADRIPIGLTAEGTRPEGLERHRVVFERNCSFVSYNVHHLPNPFVEWVRTERRAPVISWTVRTPDDVERSCAHADQMTFEGFLPPS